MVCVAEDLKPGGVYLGPQGYFFNIQAEYFTKNSVLNILYLIEGQSYAK